MIMTMKMKAIISTTIMITMTAVFPLLVIVITLMGIILGVLLLLIIMNGI